jgi:hypothetical protein
VTARTAHGARYGAAHQAARKAALEALRLNPATPCVRCGGPLDLDHPSTIHLDHADSVSDTYLGLSCGSCNMSHGAKLGNSMRRWGPAQEPPPEPSGHTRGWCRICGRRDCAYAAPDAPYGRQPW